MDEYKGPKMVLQKVFWVEYAHRLQDHSGYCKHLHGHSGKVTVEFEGPIDKKTGMIIDFGSFGWLKKIVEELDHSLVLQENDPIRGYLLEGVDNARIDQLRLVTLLVPPTAENIVLYLRGKIEDHIAYSRDTKQEFHTWFRVSAVSFEETRNNQVQWRVE